MKNAGPATATALALALLATFVCLQGVDALPDTGLPDGSALGARLLLGTLAFALSVLG